MTLEQSTVCACEEGTLNKKLQFIGSALRDCQPCPPQQAGFGQAEDTCRLLSVVHKQIATMQVNLINYFTAFNAALHGRRCFRGDLFLLLGFPAFEDNESLLLVYDDARTKKDIEMIMQDVLRPLNGYSPGLDVIDNIFELLLSQ